MNKDDLGAVSVPHLNPQQNPSIVRTIRKFWSKYIYNGFFDIYNKGRSAISGDENFDYGSRMYDEYQDFNDDEIDLMKDMNPSQRSESMNLETPLDGLERL